MMLLKESGGRQSDVACISSFRRKEGLSPKMIIVVAKGGAQLSALFEDCFC